MPDKGSQVQNDLKRKSITMPSYIWALLKAEAEVYGTNTSILLQRIALDYFRLPNNDQ